MSEPPVEGSGSRRVRRIGRYQIEEAVGTGAFATVYRAFDERLDDTVAVKVLADNHSLDPDLRERFLTEGRVLRRIDSPNVLTVHDLGETEDRQPFLVLEHADRGTLEKRAAELRGRGWRPGPADLWSVAEPLGRALEAVHQADVVHRDLNPGNVLLTTRTATGANPTSALVWQGERLVLADLGLCKDLALSSGYTSAGGTEGFRPPELRHGPAIIDGRADLWSLSALMVWLITGSPPGDGSVEDSIAAAGLPAALAEALNLGLAVDPEARHQDPAAWLEAVGDALGQRATAGASSSPAALADRTEVVPHLERSVSGDGASSAVAGVAEPGPVQVQAVPSASAGAAWGPATSPGWGPLQNPSPGWGPAASPGWGPPQSPSPRWGPPHGQGRGGPWVAPATQPVAPRRELASGWWWKLRHSAWLLSTLFVGLTTWGGFLYIGKRAGRRDWCWFAALYGLGAVVMVTLMVLAPEDAEGNVDSRAWQDDVGAALMAVLWIGGIVHGFIVNGAWLRWRATSRDQPGQLGQVADPQPAGAVPAQYLQEPWRSFARGGGRAQARVRDIVGRTEPGPLHDRLSAIGARVSVIVETMGTVAAHGDALARARGQIDSAGLDAALSAVNQELASAPGSPAALQRVDALEAQRASALRLDDAVGSTLDKLRLLDARLNEAITLLQELAVGTSGGPGSAEVFQHVDDLLADMKALQTAVEEIRPLGDGQGMSEAAPS